MAVNKTKTNGKKPAVSKKHDSIPMVGEVGRTGLRQNAGRIDEEFLVELKRHNRYKIYNEMLHNEPLIATMDFSLRKLISQVKWEAEAASEDAVDVEAAEFIDSCLHDMEESWENTLHEILSFPAFGFSVHEVVLKQRIGPLEDDLTKRSEFTDGRIGWRKLPIRGQDTIIRWIENKEKTEYIGIEQRLPTGDSKQRIIPKEKLLHFKNNSSKGNPEGQSIFRPAYVPWFYKKKLQSIEAIGSERELNGIPLIRIPGKLLNKNATVDDTANADAWKSIGRDIRSDEQACLIIPSDRDKDGNFIYDIELLSTQGRRAIDLETVIHRYSVEITAVILADFILLGHERIGTQSLSSNKTTMFSLALNSFMQEVVSVFNKKAIPQLMSVNTFNTTKFPKLVHGDIETEDIERLALAMQAFAAAGHTVTDIETQNEVRRRINFPKLDKDMDLTVAIPGDEDAKGLKATGAGGRRNSEND